MRVTESERATLMSGDAIEDEEYKLIDQEIARFAQDLLEKDSLAQTVEDLLSKQKKLDSNQLEEIVFDVQYLQENVKKTVELASKYSYPGTDC